METAPKEEHEYKVINKSLSSIYRTSTGRQRGENLAGSVAIFKVF